MKKKGEWKRYCLNPDHNPNCEKIIPYTTKRAKNWAEKRNTNCRSCAMRSEEVRKKISKSMMGDKNPTKKLEVRKKMSKSKLGDKNPAKRPEVRKKISENNGCYWKGKNFTDEHKKNIGKFRKGKTYEEIFGKEKAKEVRKKRRLTMLKNIKDRCGQVIPNYNKFAISRLEEEAKKYNITDLQHAENGGEFQVCGYFVDGRSKEKNIVIEYYEKAHKYQTERDKRRKYEIIKELGCIFIEIWE